MLKGRVESIGITPAAKAPMLFVTAARAVAGKGLEGDRYFTKEGTFSKEPGEGRHVTLIESEAVDVGWARSVHIRALGRKPLS